MVTPIIHIDGQWVYTYEISSLKMPMYPIIYIYIIDQSVQSETLWWSQVNFALTALSPELLLLIENRAFGAPG